MKMTKNNKKKMMEGFQFYSLLQQEFTQKK